MTYGQALTRIWDVRLHLRAIGTIFVASVLFVTLFLVYVRLTNHGAAVTFEAWIYGTIALWGIATLALGCLLVPLLLFIALASSWLDRTRPGWRCRPWP